VAEVERIELFEDRAAVIRRIVLPDGPGRHHVVVEGLSPLLMERTVVFPGTPELLVEEIRVVRGRVARRDADPGVASRLSERERELRAAREGADDAYRRAVRGSEGLDAALEAALDWLPRLLLVEDPEPALAALRELCGARFQRADSVVARAVERDAAIREHDAVAAQLATARHGAPEWRCRLELRVVVQGALAAVPLRYTLPCAVWRPVHRAVLQLGERPRVSWEVGAMAWNATGEDWRGVALVCSTRRPGEHASAPVLGDDPIVTRKRDKEVLVEAREEIVHVAREGVAQRATEVPGVDDGGEPRTFTAPHPVDLPSDGRPVHVRLEAWESTATVAWVAHPERSSAVVLRSRQPNTGSRPILAGPVELVRDAGAVGRGRVGYVAAGEPFPMGWGSHDGVRVTRRADQKVDRSRITGYQSWSFAVVLKLANNGHEAVTVEVKERVPVSEIADVRVGVPVAVPPLASGPDADGICTWRLVVEPGVVRPIELSYTVEAPASVRLPF
jgi:uncharacterized protein (TIGR02231 family)